MRIVPPLLALLLASFSAPGLAGEFGNHCTTGLAEGRMMPTRCDVNAMFEGKTYCFSSEQAKKTFLAAPAETARKAKSSYMKQQAAEPVREKLSQEAALALIRQKSCDLSNKDVGYLDFKGMKLGHCKMVNTSFFGADLRGASLSGANMQRAYLNLARLENADLSGADLTDAIIFQAIFDKTSFKGANLTHARVIGTLGAVDMSGANVRNGRLGLDVGNQPMGQMKFDSTGGNFANANFEGADLNIASFAFGNLSGANLRDTNLYRADLSQADLTGADLTGANLTDAVVDGATVKNTKGLDNAKGIATVKGKFRR